MTDLAQGLQTSAIYWLVNDEPYKAVINDPSDPDYVGGLGGSDGITGLDAPELRENAVIVTEGHGGLHGNFWADRRPVTLTVEVNPNVAAQISTRESVLERLRRASNLYSADGTLIWFPGDPAIVSTTRTNLVADPSFEFDVVGNAPGVIQAGEFPYGFLPTVPWNDPSPAQWTTRTFAVAAANATHGANSLRIKGTKDATATARILQARSDYFSVVPGRAYSARADSFIADAPATGTGTYLRMWFWDANKNSISSADSNVIAAGTAGAQTLTANNKVAPANAVYGTVQVSAESTTSGDVVDLYIDRVQCVAEAAAGAYLDGESANSSWLGLQGFGQSVNRPDARFITVRRQQPTRISGKGYSKQVFLALVAADPRIYSTEMHRQEVAHATGINIENQGDWEAPAIWRVYGPYNAGTVTITRTANGVPGYVKWTKSADGSAVNAVQADSFHRSLMLNPTTYPPIATNMYGQLDFAVTTWPGIMPGPTNAIRVDCSGGGTTAGTVLGARWRDTWL